MPVFCVCLGRRNLNHKSTQPKYRIYRAQPDGEDKGKLADWPTLQLPRPRARG